MRLDEYELLIFDGACGTNLQTRPLAATVWQGCSGCHEILNLTAPEVVIQLHQEFLAAGAMALETNTFGGCAVVLQEYGLADQVGAINYAAVRHARQAIGQGPQFVVGAVGPTTKLPSLGHITVDALAAAYQEQMEVLVEAGVDGLLLETCQDLLQLKTGLLVAFETLTKVGREIPIMVSVTIETTGVMLVGTDISAVVATLEPFPIFSLGLNCATGPLDMVPCLRYLSRHWNGRISCMPNQGLPELLDGRTVYRLEPEIFVQHMREFVTTLGVSIVGGCCGTTPRHIQLLATTLAQLVPQRQSSSHGLSEEQDETLRGEPLSGS